MTSPLLDVCLCVEEEEHCVIPLHEIAAGHVFGSQQHLKLTLHGQHTEALHELVSSIQECCFHLVDEVSVAPNTSIHYDVAIVLLSPKDSPLIHSQGQSSSKDIHSLANFLSIITEVIGDNINEHSKVLVLGPSSNAVATILSHRLGSIGGNQLLAFQSNQNPTWNNPKGRNPIRGQYRTAHSLSQAVSDWWAGNKSTPKGLTAGIKFFGRKNSTSIQNGGVFFSVPVDIVGEKTFKVNPSSHINLDEVKKVIYETETAFDEMRQIECIDKRCTTIAYAQL